VYASPNIIWVIKSRRMRWTGNVARMGEMRNAYRMLVGRSEGKNCVSFSKPSLLDGFPTDPFVILVELTSLY
jgi:hypothetical protein